MNPMAIENPARRRHVYVRGSGGVSPRASSTIIRGESEPGSKLTRKKNFLWQSATLSRCLNQSSKPSVPMMLPMKNTNCPR